MRWIIGDIHGMLRPLEALLRDIARRDPWAHLLFVGDYVNRGPSTNGVLELLSSLRNAHFVRGNHDDIFDLILHGECYAHNPSAPDAVSAFKWFMQYGLDQTFMSYGIDSTRLEQAAAHPTAAQIRKFADAVPEKHRRFIRRLGGVIEHDDLFVAHGMWDVNDGDTSPPIADRLKSEMKNRQRILWGRFGKEVLTIKRWNRTGYFGHTPVESFPQGVRPEKNVPIRADKIVLLDTGSAVSSTGKLSAVCAETSATLQADRAGNIVAIG